MMFPVTIMTAPTITAAGIASSDVYCCVCPWDTSRCASQQCANMKRHIRVIGPLPARIALHNQRLGAFQVQRAEGGRQSGHWLCCQQHSEQAKNSLGTCSSLQDIRCCLKCPLTPSHRRVTRPDHQAHSELRKKKRPFHLSAPNIFAH